MSFETPNFMPAMPEMFVLGMGCLILILDLFISERNRVVTYLLTQATLVGAFILTLSLFGAGPDRTFSGTFVSDQMAVVLKLFIYMAAFAVFLYSRGYMRRRNMLKGEYFVLGLFGVLGMMVMVSAHSMLTIYLGLELLSLAMYAMVAMQRDSIVASEAAMKYFILGAMASALLLYGMSMIYGVTGTLDLVEVSQAIAAGDANNLVLSFGMVFLIVGIAFKLGAVPFHMWVPDVYHGAPTSVTLYIATAPKLAAFAMLMRLLVDGLGEMQAQWHDIIMILAVLSIITGNVIAIAQSNIKRMLAYSGISHIGFLLLGILAGDAEGYASSMFYAVVYVIMTLGGFGMVLVMSRAGFEAENLADFKGLNQRSPWFAGVMLIIMFSMAGIPPFLGFWAKLAVIQSVVSSGDIALAIIAVLFSVIGAFYYLRVVKMMYFDEPEDRQPIQSSSDLRFMVSLNGVAVLLLGLAPSTLMGLCLASMNASMM